MKLFNFFLSFVLSLILVLGLFTFQLSLFTHSKLYNSNMYFTKYQELNLYDTIDTSINTAFTTFSKRCNLPNELFNNIVSKQWVESEVKKITKNYIDYMTYNTNTLYILDSKSQETTLNNNMNSFLKSSNLKVDKNVEGELNKVKQDGINIIKNNVSPINLNALLNSSSFQNLRKALNYLYSFQNYILLFLIIISMFLFLVNIKNIYNFIKWLSFSIIAGGLMIVIPALLGFNTDFTKNLALGIPIAKLILGTMLNEYIRFFLYCGAIIAFTGILLLIATIVYEGSLKRKRG